jgi:hypothetical protein
MLNDENGNLLAYSHNILNRWKNFSKLLNVHRGSDVRQIDIHTAEPLIAEPSLFEADIAIVKLEKCNSQGPDQTPVEQI